MSGCAPASQAGSSPVSTSSMPTWSAMGAAAAAESPVSMSTRRPAPRREATAAAASGRNASRASKQPAGWLFRAIQSRVNPGLGGCDAVGQADGEFAKQSLVSQHAVKALDLGGETAARQDLNVLGWPPFNLPCSCCIHDGVGQRMVRLLLGRGGKAKQIVSLYPMMGRIAASTGCPTVRVPVLSSTTVSRWATRSRASPPLNRIPICAPRPTATVSAAGTASPMAHGQAMTSTATVLARANAGNELRSTSLGSESRKQQHRGHKDGAGAVGQPLHRRP